MKSLKKSLLAVLLASPTISFAVPGSLGNVTVALKVSISVAGTYNRDPQTGAFTTPKEEVRDNEWTIIKYKNGTQVSKEYLQEELSKASVFKLGNKEILMQLQSRNLLPESTDITGWSIVEVTGNAQRFSSYYAVHKEKGRVKINSYFDIDQTDEDEGGYFTSNSKYNEKTTYLPSGEVASTKLTRSDTMTFRKKSTCVINTGFNDITKNTMTGILTYSIKLGTILGDEKNEWVYIRGASKFTNISGTGPMYQEARNEPALVEGTISVSAGKALRSISDF